MSTTTTTTWTATPCPSWCTEDWEAEAGSHPPTHFASVEVDGLPIEFGQGWDDDGPVFMPPDAGNGLPLLEARRDALALLEACSRIEGHNTTGLVWAWTMTPTRSTANGSRSATCT